MQLHNTQVPFGKKILSLFGIVTAMTVLGIVIGSALYLLTKNVLLMEAVSTVTIFGGSSYLYWLLFDKKEFVQESFLSVPEFRWILTAVAFWLISLPTVNNISVDSDYSDLILRLVKDTSLSGLVLLVFVMALLPAIFEEWMFRGVLQRLLIQGTNRVWLGIVIASAVFSAVHLDMPNFFTRFLLGIFLGLLYQYSGKLWVNITFHFINNAIAAIGLWLYVTGRMQSDNYIFPIWMFLLSCALIVLFIVWNEMKNKRSVKNNYIEGE